MCARGARGRTGDQTSSSARCVIRSSAAWTERTAPVRVSRVVSSLRSLIAVARRRRGRRMCISRKGYAWRVSTSPARSGPPALDDERLGRLLEAAEELAKRWLLTLLAARPLRDGVRALARLFAAEAPEVCERVLRALRSDAELDRLRERRAAKPRRGPRGIAAILGASDGPALVEAVEALRASMWGAIEDAFPTSTRRRPARSRTGSPMRARCWQRRSSTGWSCRRGAPSRSARGGAGRKPGAAEGTDEADRGPRIEMQEEGRGRGGRSDRGPWAIEPPVAEDEPSWPHSVATEIERHQDPDAPFVVLVIEVVGLERLREAEERARARGASWRRCSVSFASRSAPTSASRRRRRTLVACRVRCRSAGGARARPAAGARRACVGGAPAHAAQGRDRGRNRAGGRHRCRRASRASGRGALRGARERRVRAARGGRERTRAGAGISGPEPPHRLAGRVAARRR